MNKVRINQGRILMWQFRLAGTLIVFTVIAGSLANLPEIPAIAISVLVSLLVPMLWSSYYLLEIDPGKKTYSEISWIAGYKTGKTHSYRAIEKIFINNTRVSQRITTYSGQAHTVRSREYRAYLKFSDDKKLFLLSDDNPEKLKEKLAPVVQKLKVTIVENY